MGIVTLQDVHAYLCRPCRLVYNKYDLAHAGSFLAGKILLVIPEKFTFLFPLSASEERTKDGKMSKNWST